MPSAPVSERLRVAMNAHDIDGFVACFVPDYLSEQPAHPDRAFSGHDQVRTNWAAIFEEVPDVEGELIGAVACDGAEWRAWRIFGTRRDGSPMEMRGVIINGIRRTASHGPVCTSSLWKKAAQELTPLSPGSPGPPEPGGSRWTATGTLPSYPQGI